MHQIYYEHCIVCGSRFEPYELQNNYAMKCPKADDWRKVIDSKMPQAESSQKADEISKALKKLGVNSSGYYLGCYSDSDIYIVRIDALEDALTKLMRHEPVDGALVHDREIVCQECVMQMRKDAYNGEGQVPEIECPICKTVLVQINKK